jgi:hypothetical protein
LIIYTLQNDLDEINKYSHFGLVDIGRAANIDASGIARMLVEFRNLNIMSKTESDASSLRLTQFDGNDRITTSIFLSGGFTPEGNIQVTTDIATNVISENEASWLTENIVNVLRWIERSQGRLTLSDMDIISQKQLNLVMTWSGSLQYQNQGNCHLRVRIN